MLILPRRLTRQPQPGARIASANPLTSRLRLCFYGASNVAGLPTTTPNGLDAVRSGASGISIDYTGGGNGARRWVGAPGMPRPLVDATLFALVEPHDLTAEASAVGMSSSSSNSPWIRLEYRPDFSQWNFQTGSDAGTYINHNGGPNASVGRADILIGVLRAGTGQKELWVNGVRVAASTTDSGTITLNQAEIGTLWRSSPVQFFNGPIYLAGVFDRALSQGECLALSSNPWQLFEHEPRRLWVGLSAATGGFFARPYYDMLIG